MNSFDSGDDLPEEVELNIPDLTDQAFQIALVGDPGQALLTEAAERGWDPSASPHRIIGQSGGVNPDVKLTFYHVDHLGTPRVITDVDGNIVSRHKYLPFGEELSPPPSTNTHEFTGHERDAETGLDYMKARMYGQGSTFRFLSVDPGDDTTLESPQSWNKYVYVRNNPMKFFDPDGEATIPHTETVPYPVTGSTAAEAWSSAKKMNSDGKPGHTSWTIAVTKVDSMAVGGGDTGTATSIPTEVTVVVTTTVTVPEWTAPEGASPEEQKTFDAQDASLKKHEQGHVDIANKGGEALEKKIMNTVGTGQGPTAANAKANAKADLMGKAKQAEKDQGKATAGKQKAYDTTTGSGAGKP